MIGYWVCPPALRGQVDKWDGLDGQDAEVADNDLRLMGSVLAR